MTPILGRDGKPIISEPRNLDNAKLEVRVVLPFVFVLVSFDGSDEALQEIARIPAPLVDEDRRVLPEVMVAFRRWLDRRKEDAEQTDEDAN